MPELGRAPLDPADLARAIGEDGLRVVHQPKIALNSGGLAGVETLARWQHPRLGNVSPGDFIPLAEANGLIDPLTEWVVAAAAMDWVAWHQRGLTTSLAINISAKSLSRPDFPDLIEHLCRQHGMPSERLIIELTETAMIGPVELLDALIRFRIKGFEISLDDFGTGYSTLAQVLRAPFSELKIDQSFVTHADSSKESRIVLKASIDLAHNLGLRAVAEGVETEAVAALLTDMGCDLAQGYYFAKPMPAASPDFFRLYGKVESEKVFAMGGASVPDVGHG
jgi:EAL domain-containing protein (putative c-di-GMP-specific phosphodiesterase class I)